MCPSVRPARCLLQANKRLASNDFIMGDGTLSELDSSEEAQESEEEEQEASEGDVDDDLESLLHIILSKWVVQAGTDGAGTDGAHALAPVCVE